MIRVATDEEAAMRIVGSSNQRWINVLGSFDSWTSVIVENIANEEHS